MDALAPGKYFGENDWSEEASNELTPMRQFYKGKTVFLTGGTGFLGQLYVEKLLRCEVKHIYLLGRAKRGKSAEERVKNTFIGTHFSRLRKQDPNYLKRISIIEGEMEKINVGITEEDQIKLIENVEVVIHAAADVRFDEKLKTLLMINLRGTREMLNLTARMKKILAFTFISTAYSNCPREYIEEKFYESPVDPEVMIKLGEYYNQYPDETLEILTERIIKPWPNTYTYTKALTEELVRRYSTKFPICVIRPSIVISTHEDPVPAWCNNIYGLNGVLVACGLGVLRLVPLHRKNIGDIVCADFVINSTLAAIWATHEDKVKQETLEEKPEKTDPEVYHVCTSTDMPVTWGKIADDTYENFKKNPSKRVLWRHCYNSVTNPFWIKYLTLFYHVIPAFLSDILLKILGKKLRVLPIYRKVQRFSVALSFFMHSDWRFDNSNMRRVLNRMVPQDQEFFPSDVRRCNWSTYVLTYIQGLKVYISHESLDDTKKAIRRFRILTVLHFFVLVIYYGVHIAALTFLAYKVGLFTYLRNTACDTYEFLKNPQIVQ